MRYFKYIINKFRNEKQSAESINEFKQWLIDPENEAEKESALQDLWDSIPNTLPTDETLNALHSLENRIGIAPQPKTRKMSLAIRFWQSVAAVLFVVAATSAFLFFNNQPELQDLVEGYCPNAELQRIELPDGSIAELNSETALLYPLEFNGKTRSVYLVGEANFKVAKNAEKPFIVKTSNFQVTALGTEFNVTSYASDANTYVTLLSGSVLVENGSVDERFILKPGDQLIYNRKNKEIRIEENANVESVTAWQRGEITIRDLTLSQVLNLLERKYPIQFNYSDQLVLSNTDRYNFTFNKDASINEIMTVIQTVVGNINYKIENDICYLR